MGITAKELAIELGLSEAAISMALNNKPGVSTKTRKRVVDAAKKGGYDFSRLSQSEEPAQIKGTIQFVVYRKSGAVIPDQRYTRSGYDEPFFAKLSEGISASCKKCNYFLNISYMYEGDDVQSQLNDWKRIGVKGILLLGTEMDEHNIEPFIKSDIPLVLIDNYYETLNLNCVVINNVQGAFNATNMLFKKKHSQPGYLCSSYPTTSFEERADGFYKAIRKNGMSTSRSVSHRLPPSLDAAYSDMLDFLKQDVPVAKCYFADNDQIAAGAIKAFLEMGYKIPNDIAVIGFDDMPLCNFINPPLTTIHVPKQYMGELATKRLAEIIEEPNSKPVKIEVGTEIVKRKSC